MALSVTQSGVKLLQAGQRVTNAILNQLGLRTVTVTGQVDASQIEADAVTAAKTKTDAHAFATTETNSTAAVHVLTTGSSLTDGGVADGTWIAWRAQNANSGAVNITVDSMTSRDLMKQHDTELASGDIEAGQIIEARWDATNLRWQMTSQIAQ